MRSVPTILALPFPFPCPLSLEVLQPMADETTAHQHDAAGPGVSVCPHCGYCPTCGRANTLPPPYRPWPWAYPWWGVVPPPGLTWPVYVKGTTVVSTSGKPAVYVDTTGVGFSTFTN